MSETPHRFLRSASGAASIEYALLGMGVAVVIVVAVGALYARVAGAFP